LLEAIEVIDDFANRVVIVFFDREFEQLAGIVETAGEFVERDDDLFELRALLSQRLRSFRVVPDIGLLEFALDLYEAFGLALVVKDTPSTQRCVRRDRLSSV
jgi:hypothetical protein